MKRIVAPTLLLLCALCLSPNEPSGAQQIPVKKLTTLEWKKLGDDIRALRIWQLEGAEVYPQVAVLRVSNATYLKYFQDPKAFMEFVNAQRVFSKDIIISGPWVSLSPLESKDDPTDWVLTLVHGKRSTMIVSALPQLKEEYAPKMK